MSDEVFDDEVVDDEIEGEPEGEDQVDESEDESEPPSVEELQEQLQTAQAEAAELKKERDGFYGRVRGQQRQQRRMEQRLDRLDSIYAEEGPPESDLGKEPDKDEDPTGWLDYQRRADRLERDQQDWEARAQQQAVYQQQQRIQGAVAAAGQGEVAFLESPGAPSQEEYRAALNFARGHEVERLQRLSGLNEIEARQAVSNLEMGFIDEQVQAGVNPAHAAWEYARSLGYVGKASDGSAKKPDEIARIERGVKSGGISNARGGGPKKGMKTYKQIAEMSESEFNAWADEKEKEVGRERMEEIWEKADETGRVYY
jgi:hypothetical protein